MKQSNKYMRLYKRGDVVQIKSYGWYKKELKKQNTENFIRGPINVITGNMAEHCGERVIISCISSCDGYTLKGLSWAWYDWMFEDQFEEKLRLL